MGLSKDARSGISTIAEYALRECSRQSSGRLRQRHDERRSPLGVVLSGNRTAVRLHNTLRDAQTKAVAARLLGPRAIHTKKRLKQLRQVRIGDASAIVHHTNDHAVGILGD